MLPKNENRGVGLEPQSTKDSSLAQGSIVVPPLPQPAWSLEDLLAQVTDENLHDEVGTGSPVGREFR
jgi:antitoxin component of MazEF toxin-antitoxin module